MNIHEHQAKEVLKKYGANVPNGYFALNVKDLVEKAKNLNTKKYVLKTQIHSGDSSNHPFMTGLISRHDGDWIVVSSVGKEMFLIEEVIDDKNKNIIQKLKVGDRFITPLDKIYLSKKNRPKYNSMGLKKKN